MANLAEVYDKIDDGWEDVLTQEERDLLPEKPEKKSGFSENLAESLEDDVLSQIGNAVMDGFTSDEDSRSDWRKREAIGIKLLGISEDICFDIPFKGASTAVHPGLSEAIIQFQARAISELWPPQGPAKAITEGSYAITEREQQAFVVAEYLNWVYCSKMPGGYQQHDRMLFRLPLSGSAFKKVFYDPLEKTTVSKFYPAEVVVIPYGATDLLTTPRISHILNYSESDILKMFEVGAYREVELGRLAEDQDPTDLQPELDKVSSTKQSLARIQKSTRYVLIEQSIMMDLEGEPDNSPYLVTVDKESREVFAVYRDWRENDEFRKRRQRFVHYYFLPGLDGFYGLGLLHFLGRLAESLTGNLRALMDSAQLANLPGGFRSSDVKLPRSNRGDSLKMVPGEFPAVDATADELSKLFIKLPFGEPSQTLFNLLQYQDELMRRVGWTTSELVGESTKNVPVGTTLARIEQGLKVQSAIQIRCHQSQAQELAMMCELISETLPDEDYCRDVLGTTPEEFAKLFDGKVDVRPVSDPNAITATQRMVIAQTMVDMANQAPDVVDRREAYKRLLETMRVQNIEALLPQKDTTARMGPIEENMAMVQLQPVKAYPDQDQEAHLATHRPWRESLDPETLKRVGPAAIAHEAEHMAFAYAIKMQQMMGIQLPQPGQQMAPEAENQLAMMAAQASQLMAQIQEQSQPVDPNTIVAQGKANADQMRAEAEIRRKDAIAAAQSQRDDTAMMDKMSRDAAQHEANLISKYMSTAAKAELAKANPKPQ